MLGRKLLENKPSKRKVLLAGLALLVAIYLAFCADFYFRQEWYILEPNVVPPGYRDSELKYKPYQLSVRPEDGGKATIHFRKYKTTATPRNEVVFYLHGNKGNMDLCAFQIEFLLGLGYDVWTMDYRGYGDSTGIISESALKEDANKVFDKIVNEDSAEPIVIWGRSFGSGVAASVAAAAKKKPKMLVLETPYWSLIDVVRQKLFFMPSAVFRYELPTHEFLISASYPIHLIHGTQDEKISPNSSDRLHNLCEANGIKVIGHSIMCGKHDLRDDKTVVEFQEIAAGILKVSVASTAWRLFGGDERGDRWARSSRFGSAWPDGG